MNASPQDVALVTMQRRRDFFKKSFKMFVLIPRGHAQRDVLDAGGKIGFQLVDALLADCPPW